MKTARIVSMFLRKDPGHGRIRSHLLILPFTALLLVSSQSFSFAESATWQLNPTSGDWNTAGNWMPSTVPNGAFPSGPFDTATFGPSNGRDVSLSAETNVNAIVFDADASAFTITTRPFQLFRLMGPGVSNNSGTTQHFVAASPFGLINFRDEATAGADTSFTIEGAAQGGGGSGAILFGDSSDAGTGAFIIPPNAVSGDHGGFILFDGNSSAANATFAVGGGGVSTAMGGFIQFSNAANAGSGVFTISGAATSGAGSGSVTFQNWSGAGFATLIANGGLSGGEGGLIEFADRAHGGSARVEIFGNGSLDLSRQKGRRLTIGSLEGNGKVFLGSSNLRVGRNDLDTFFSGVIRDGGLGGGGGGSLTKIGRGKLVLHHRNAYTGGTTVRHGKLIVNNALASGTGTGPVQVEGGQLGGKGTIAGAVTIGTGTGNGAALSPGYLHGAGRPGSLTIQGPLIFNSDAIYRIELSSSDVTADEVSAGGVTINPGAQFAFTDIGRATLTAGTAFNVINNTSATAIAGTFTDLPDGAIFTARGNTYQVNYEGGDGNDLTLTVVP